MLFDSFLAEMGVGAPRRQRGTDRPPCRCFCGFVCLPVGNGRVGHLYVVAVHEGGCGQGGSSCRTLGLPGQNLAQIGALQLEDQLLHAEEGEGGKREHGDREEVGAGEGAALISRASPGNPKSPHWRFFPSRNLPLPCPVDAEARAEHLRWGWAARAALAGAGLVSHGQQLGR